MSAQARPDLRIIDGNGEVDEDSVAIPSEYALLLEQYEKALEREARLKRRLNDLRVADPQADVISGVLEYWRKRCGHPKAKIPMTGARAQKVKARLMDGYTPEQLRSVIDAVAARPFMGLWGERFCCEGPGRKRKDDPTLIFRDERHVEDLLALRLDEECDHKAYRRFVYQAASEMPEVKNVLALLGSQAPHGTVLAKAATWAHGLTSC